LSGAICVRPTTTPESLIHQRLNADAFGTDSGVVVGRTQIAPDNHGGMFRWSSQTGTEDLNALGAPVGLVEAIDINSAGDIVATIDLPGGASFRICTATACGPISTTCCRQALGQ